MTVPSDYDFIGNTITESQFKNALTVLLNHIRQMSLDLVEAQGGNYSYATMALFDVDKINVPANSTIRIAQGGDAGLYVWDGSNLTPAKESNFFESSISENLFEWKDSTGNVVLALNKKGQLVSYDENTKRTILLTNQEDIKELQKFADELKLNNISVLMKLLSTRDSSDIHRWEDLNGLPLLRLTKTGKLRSHQIDDIELTLSDIKFVSDVIAQQQSPKLLKFCDLNNIELGYVDEFARWILSGVDVLGEIQDLKTKGTTSSNVSRLKHYVFQPPESLVQIYVTSNGALPLDKSYKAQGKVEVHIDGQSFSSYVSLEVQGSSSVGYPKKNYTLEFFSDAGYSQALKVQVGDVPAHDEWVFKANYVDASNSRNIGGNKLWEDMVQSRIASNGYKREVDQYYVGKTGDDAIITNAVGHVVGYPCVMYVNDEFYGVGSFNIGKKYFNYNLDRTKPTQIQIDWGGSQCDLTKMYDNYISGAVDYKGEPVFEFKSPKKVTNDTLACLSAWDAFAASSQSSFTQNANTFLNKQNAIDYYLFSDFTMNYDGLGKNFQFVSWNGVQFNFMPYDLDSIFGSNYSGTGTIPSNGVLDVGGLPQNTRNFWNKLKTTYLSDMKLRYKQLRDAKIFHEDNVYKICMDIASKYPRDLILTEFDKWPDRPSKTYSNVNQIVSWSKQRLAYLDTQYEYIA